MDSLCEDDTLISDIQSYVCGSVLLLVAERVGANRSENRKDWQERAASLTWDSRTQRKFSRLNKAIQ